MISKIILSMCFIYCNDFSSASQQEPPQTRIIGGEKAKIEDFPYQISMQWTYGLARPTHFCGGSIISPEHIVTAAHCVDSKQRPDRMKYVKIYTGTSRTDFGGQYHEVKSIDVHPKYRGASNTYLDDIAVVTLKTPIHFTKVQQPIKLPSHDVKDGSNAMVTGWGITKKYAQQTPLNMQKAAMRLVDSVQCRRKLPFNLQSTQVCAIQKHGVGVCSGDSGGPLVVNGELVGIASYVIDCGIGRPDVYTNVFSYVDFIEKIVDKKFNNTIT